MLTHVSQVHAPLIFTSTCPTTEAWLPRFLAIAVVDATKRSRGLLGYFTFDELNSIEDILEDIGEPDPWPSTIDFLWSYLLTAVDEEWPLERRSGIASLLGRKRLYREGVPGLHIAGINEAA